MKISAMIEDLDANQWAEVQNLQAEYEFAEGMTHVCATFLAAPLSEGLERHVEMPLMVFTKAVARLAHIGHRVPWHDMRTPAEIEAGGQVMPTVDGIRGHQIMSAEDVALAERVARETAPHPRVIAAVWDRSEPRETPPLDLP